MIIICAVDEHWNIGYCGEMLCEIPGDLKRFKQLTTGQIIIMGRKTFESLPGGKALPNRINIVLTRNKDYKKENILVVNSLEELQVLLKKINPKGVLINFVIGGGEIVRQLLPYCNKAYITKILERFKNTDTTIPNLNQEPNWTVETETDLIKENGLAYRYVNYNRGDSPSSSL